MVVELELMPGPAEAIGELGNRLRPQLLIGPPNSNIIYYIILISHFFLNGPVSHSEPNMKAKKKKNEPVKIEG